MALPVSPIDSKSPFYDPTGRWQNWSYDDVWLDPTGPAANKYVPKIKDYVTKPDLWITYIVTALDPITYVPTLTVITPHGIGITISDDDRLLGVGPGTVSQTYVIYYDKTVTPHAFTVDQRLFVGGTDAAYAKIFHGTDTSQTTGKVIGQIYDSSNQFVSDQIPLVLAAIETHANHTIKTVQPCSTSYELTNGDIATVVLYNSSGTQISQGQCRIQESTFVKSVTAQTKYISHIALYSSFTSPTIDHTLEIPINITIASLGLMGEVYYSDGSMRRLPVDGTKFTVLGLDQFVATQVGERVDLVLRYQLDPTEQAVGGAYASFRYITEPYELLVTALSNAHGVKLYAYPEWVDMATGYTLKWALFNLERNAWFDATGAVYFNASDGFYNPKAYGVVQKRSVRVNLSDISGTFPSYLHVQPIDIILASPPDPVTDSMLWQVGFDVGVSNTLYGTALYLQATHLAGSDYDINIASGFTSKAAWLAEIYTKIYPLYNPSVEQAPPVPTHVQVISGGLTHEIDLLNWNQNLTVTNASLVRTKTAQLIWIRRVGSINTYLGCSGLTIRN